MNHHHVFKATNDDLDFACLIQTRNAKTSDVAVTEKQRSAFVAQIRRARDLIENEAISELDKNHLKTKKIGFQCRDARSPSLTYDYNKLITKTVHIRRVTAPNSIAIRFFLAKHIRAARPQNAL